MKRGNMLSLLVGISFAISFLDGAHGQQGAVVGTVTDAVTGDPLYGVALQTHETGQWDGTDGTGWYEITLAEGTYTLEASHPLYVSATAVVTVGAGETVTQDFQLLGAEDVTQLVQENKSYMRYNRRTGMQTFYMTLTNLSADPIGEPVVLVVEDISPISLGALQNEDGTTLGGKPYFDVDVGPDGVLDPGETSAPILWRVSNPTRARWSLSISIWSGPMP